TIAEANAALPLLDAALADAERDARDVEVALAQALSAHAAEAAERRVATAAVSAAAQAHDRARRDAAQIAQSLAALTDAARFESDRDAARAAQATATEQATRARAALQWAETGETEAIAERDPAEAARAAALAALAALDAEAAALTRAMQRGGDRLLDAVRAEPGFERALAAALGDELDSALSDWTGSPLAPDDPLPPVGTLPLAARVGAPEALTRRLSQIWLVEVDSGQTLACGQRLVTREGHVRRWDGYTADGGGAAAAERLERRNRLAAIEAERPAAAAAVEAATRQRATIDERLARARAAAASARALLARADADTRDAERAEDRATAQLERLAAQRTDLATRAAQLDAAVADAAAALAAAEAARDALPDGIAASQVERLQSDAQTARAAVAAARSDRLARDRTLAAARDRRTAALAEAASWRTRAGEAAARIDAMDTRAADLNRDIAALAERPAALAAEIERLDADHAAARTQADALQAGERAADTGLRKAETASTRTQEALSIAREGRATAAARVESHELRRVEMGRVSGERFGCPAPVLPAKLEFDSTAVGTPQVEAAAHEKRNAERDRLGPVNLIAEAELAELEQAGRATIADRDELGEAVQRLRGSIGTLNREGRQRLLTAFAAVDAHFRRLFTTLFDGGSAHLEMIDSDDPLEAGLEIMAQPPGKRLQSLTLLSGGEQALTAIALIFALFLTNPAPICVLDEVDAPLDDANIERFCDLLDRMTRETDTRYLIVTHNAVTMSRMHRLFGVTMVERGVSRLVSVDLQAANTLVAAE
ncbi:chromosome segregation protein, partial [Sphingomonas sp.]|uniref:chromosome segregation protein n=1 Tax=Sphingomonas sp. TaxID=28214 RepID=UPI0035B3FAEF